MQSAYGSENVYIITDMHPLEMVLKTLKTNGIGFNGMESIFDLVLCADYEKYGNMAKAMLIKQEGIDIFIDDFEGYLCWDSSLGPQPILLKVMPDPFKPYWHDDWVSDGGDFGRRKMNLTKT